jgi:hypothetical protein
MGSENARKCTQNTQAADHCSHSLPSYFSVGNPPYVHLYLYMSPMFLLYCVLQAHNFFFSDIPSVPEMSTSFTSYIVQVISIYLAQIL